MSAESDAEKIWSQRQQDANARALAKGGGPPHDDGMNERVAKLEATVDTIRAEIRASAAETREVIRGVEAGIRATVSDYRGDITSYASNARVDIAEHSREVDGKISSLRTWAMGGAIAVLFAVVIALINALARK
jgi:hypothetical protein